MHNKFTARLGWAALVGSATLLIAAPSASAGVTVIGGGMARDCYEAVEFSRIPVTRALEICEQALTQERLTKRNRAATFVNRGILFMRQGNHTRALWDMERGVALMPDLKEGKINLGAALYNLDRIDESLAALNEGLATEDLNARATGFYNRALIWERKGDLTAAYNDFKSALDAVPTFDLAARQLERFQVVSVPE
jgi:tetratricopeptide (TPR) repeat protein